MDSSRILLSLAGFCALVACSGPAVTEPSRITLGPADCVNPGAGVVLRYPAGWHVNTGTVLPLCSVFHPRPFALQEGTEIPYELAVMVRREPVRFETATHGFLGLEIVAQETVTVAGRPALRVETLSVDAPQTPPGLRGYQYLIDIEGETVVAETYGLGPVDFETRMRVLDAMMGSLRFTPSRTEARPSAP